MLSERSSLSSPARLQRQGDLIYTADITELVTKVSTELEHRLEVEFGATGKTLQEKIASVEWLLTPSLMRKLRYLSSFNDKSADELTPGALNRYEFIRNFEETKLKLKTIVRERSAADCAIQKCMLGIFFVFFLLTTFPSLTQLFRFS